MSQPRQAQIGKHFASALERAGVNRRPEWRTALAATMKAIREARQLPMYCDDVVTIPPVGGTGYVRRVRNLNLWLHFRVIDDVVWFTTIVTQPPVPTFDDDDDDP